MDFADIVRQSEPRTRLLYIYFQFRTYREAVHMFLHTDVRKDRLDNSQPPGIDFFAWFAIHLDLHRIDQVRLPTHSHLAVS